MALTDPQNTLAYHNSRVLTSHRDMRHVHCSKVAAALQAFRDKDLSKDTVPETEALWFYGLNHGMALVSANRAPLEPLSDWENEFVRLYHETMAEKAVRAFYYLLWICIRESRHNQSLAKDAPKMKELFGDAVTNFTVSIKGGESGISAAFVTNPPNATIGTYVDCLKWQFYNCKWNGGYGGKKWGIVTDCLSRFVDGEFTAEMMLDTIWTLSHNNGPIFNKGEFFGHYSPNLIRILDVQRSGQIPEAVLCDVKVAAYAPTALLHRMAQLQKRFPGKLGDYVDWETVEALGSVHKYPNEKKEQFKKHGMSEKAKAAQALAEQQAKAQADADAKELADHAENWFQVMPGLEVPKIKRAA
jgi:hypothetical protein